MKFRYFASRLKSDTDLGLAAVKTEPGKSRGLSLSGKPTLLTKAANKPRYSVRSVLIRMVPYVGRYPTFTRSVHTSVADPDPDWIRIQIGAWIRIRNPDPDPAREF